MHTLECVNAQLNCLFQTENEIPSAVFIIAFDGFCLILTSKSDRRWLPRESEVMHKMLENEKT